MDELTPPRRTPRGDIMLAALISGNGQHYLNEFRVSFKRLYGYDHPATDDDELRNHLVRLLMGCKGRDQAS